MRRKLERLVVVIFIALLCFASSYVRGEFYDDEWGAHEPSVLRNAQHASDLFSGEDFGSDTDHTRDQHLGNTQILNEYFSRSIGDFERLSPTERWVLAGDVANYLNFSVTERITIGVPVNLIFIGFDGDGNHDLELSAQDIVPWFKHVEDQLPHLVVPMGEEALFTRKTKSVQSHVDYRLFVNVVKLSPFVNNVVEDIIMWNMRDEVSHDDDQHTESKPPMHDDDRHDLNEEKHDAEMHYVNPHRLSSVLHHMLHSLNLADAYSLIVLNPKNAVGPGEVYGYRTGFSQSELNKLHMNDQLEEALEGKIGPHIDADPVMPSEEDIEIVSRTKVEYEGAHDIQWHRLIEDSERWARSYIKGQALKQADQLETHDQPPRQIVENWADALMKEECGDGDSLDCIYRVRYESDLPDEPTPIEELALDLATRGSDFEKNYVHDAGHGVSPDVPMQETCLVDMWIGHHRYAFIDMTAGPFSWGPLIAGHGVRSHHTIPRVPRFTDRHVQELRETTNGEVILQSLMRLRELHDDYAPCLRDETDSGRCKLLEKRMEREKKMLASMPEFDADMANAFLSGGIGEGADGDQVLDQFLSELGSLLSRSISQLVVPPSALFAPRFSERVVFHLYVVSDQDTFPPLSRNTFWWERYKREMLKFKLPHQEFVFTYKKMSMRDDAAIASAFSSSLRHSSIPSLSVDGKFEVNPRTYVDTMMLQEQLRVLNLVGHTEEEEEVFGEESQFEATNRHGRHVPVFLFSVDFGEKVVLLDKYSQAKALSDFVVGIQSTPVTADKRVQCNGRKLLMRPRNPTKSLLIASALYLGSVLPHHITYSPEHETPRQDWLWSVGDSPMQLLDDQTHFSTFHIDAVHRHYVVHTLDVSIKALNRGIRYLAEKRTSADTVNVRQLVSFEQLTDLYHEVKGSWVLAVQALERMDFVKATEDLVLIERTSREFERLARSTAEAVDLFTCVAKEEIEIGGSSQGGFQPVEFVKYLVPALIALNIATVSLILATRRRKPKLKVN